MNVLELLQKKSITPKLASSTMGGEYHSACPGCGDLSKPTSNRFHVWPEQNGGEGSWWCRGCGKGGDNIQFLIEFEGMTFAEACKHLDKPISETTPRPFRRPAPARSPAAADLKEPQGPTDLWREKASKFVDWSHECLLKSRKQLRWLQEERGISMAAIEKYRLGWNRGDERGDIYRPRESWGLPTELKNGRKKKLWFPVGLVIPLIDGDAVLRIRIRRPAEDGPRYYILPGSSTRMFFTRGINYLVMESELDFILIDQEAPGLVGLLSLGSSGTKPDPAIDRALAESGVILNALDFDDAGYKAGAWWEARYPQTKRWPVPVGKDPTDSWKSGVSLREWIGLAFPKGWTNGLTRLGSLNTGDAAPLQDLSRADLPPAVLRLAELLKLHPVAVHATPDRLRLLEPAGWARKNWELSKEISNLIFLNADVLNYLSAHPEKRITGKNFLRENNHAV